jgi:hypothetical protein
MVVSVALRGGDAVGGASPDPDILAALGVVWLPHPGNGDQAGVSGAAA